MADEAKGGGGPPAAIERSRLVPLPVCGKTVEVRRWSFTRLMQIQRYLNDVFEGMPEDVAVNTREAFNYFFDQGASKILEVGRLSLAPEHRAIVDDELAAEDAFAIIQVAFDLNDANENLKKATSLAGSFLLGKAAAKAQQGSETKKTAATPEEKAS